jgi:hypothetical protein
MCDGNVKSRVAYLLGSPVLVTDVLAVLKKGKNLLCGSFLLLELLHLKRLTTTASLLLQILKSLLDELDILDTELLADNLEITNGVDITLNVDNLGIIETSDDLEDGIDGTDVGQESVSETSTSRGTTGQTSDIVDGKVSRDSRLGVVVLAQPVVTLIRNDDTRLLRVNSSVGEVLQ